MTKEEEDKIHQMFEDIKKTKRSMTNDEWELLNKTQYAQKYFFISSNYFNKLKQQK